MAIELARLNDDCPHCQAATHGTAPCPWSEHGPSFCMNSPGGRHRDKEIPPFDGFNHGRECELCGWKISFNRSVPASITFVPGKVYTFTNTAAPQYRNPHICEDPEGNRRSFWLGWLWGAATMAAVGGAVALTVL
jgi:hypothetical protein